MNIIPILNTYNWMVSGSPMGVEFEAYDTDNYKNFKYLITVGYSRVEIINAVQFDGIPGLATKLTFNQPHKFERGEIIVVGSTTPDYNGYFTVLEVIDEFNIVIERDLVGIPQYSFASKALRFKVPQNQEKTGRADIANVINDFVKSSYDAEEYMPYDGRSTRFTYDIYGGAEYEMDIQGIGITNVNGKLGVVLEPSVTDFEIGDRVNFTQNVHKYAFTDTREYSSFIGFQGSGSVYFSPNQVVEVVNYDLPEYNGNYVVQFINAEVLVTTRNWYDGSFVIPSNGYVAGIAYPEFDGNATIVDILHDGNNVTLVLSKNVNSDWATIPITGRIGFAGNQKVIKPLLHKTLDKVAYQGVQDVFEYRREFFYDYVQKTTGSELTKFSTIRTPKNGKTLTNKHLISVDSKEHLLVHSLKPQNNQTLDVHFFEGSTGLATFTFTLPAYMDQYIPIGLSQMLINPLKTPVAGSVVTDFNEIVARCTSYTVDLENRVNITYTVDRECSKYPTYDLIWRDALGSFISFPFKMASHKSVETDRKNYYRTTTRWENHDLLIDTLSAGEVSYYTQSRDKIVLNTDWISEDQMYLFKDLFNSPEVKVQLPPVDTMNGPLRRVVSCQIKQDTLELKQDIVDEIFNIQLEIRLSVDEYRR